MTQRRAPSSILAYFGTATLVAGTVLDIPAFTLTDPDKCTILLSRNTPGGTLGFLTAPTSGRGPTDTTFDIVSTNAADVSTVNWLAIPKNIGSGASSTGVNNASLRRPPSGKFVIRGVATLIAGTVAVSTAPQAFSAAAVVFVMARDLIGTPGNLSVAQASVAPNTSSFIITSDQAADVSTVDYIVVDAPLRFGPSGQRMAQSKGQLGTTGPNAAISFANMNPMNDPSISVIASRLNSSTPGQLTCPTGGRPPSLTEGRLVVTSSNNGDVSNIEVASF